MMKPKGKELWNLTSAEKGKDDVYRGVNDGIHTGIMSG
jgi:hypothetical protein